MKFCFAAHLSLDFVVSQPKESGNFHSSKTTRIKALICEANLEIHPVLIRSFKNLLQSLLCKDIPRVSVLDIIMVSVADTPPDLLHSSVKLVWYRC